MATEIYIISGFLGAGKTTLIQKLLKEAFQREKVILIENDFGEISVDAALLKSGGILVKEINSGCICCSLSGDFVRALKELLDRFHPDKIIIEPSGVGKLTDIEKLCSDPRILPFAKVAAKITVADVKRCKMYLKNFGEFFEDQIQNADVVLLSRTEDFPDKISDSCKLIKELNTHSTIISKPWDKVSAAEILYPPHDRYKSEHNTYIHKDGNDRQDVHEHGAHGNDINRVHDHSADDIFDTVTIKVKKVFSIEDLRARVSYMERSAKGNILRAKGIVRGPNGYLNLQYLPGDIHITDCTAGGDMLCIIGRDLNRQELVKLFSRE